MSRPSESGFDTGARLCYSLTPNANRPDQGRIIVVYPSVRQRRAPENLR